MPIEKYDPIGSMFQEVRSEEKYAPVRIYVLGTILFLELSSFQWYCPDLVDGYRVKTTPLPATTAAEALRTLIFCEDDLSIGKAMKTALF